MKAQRAHFGRADSCSVVGKGMPKDDAAVFHPVSQGDFS
jgi:hypothetical protein